MKKAILISVSVCICIVIVIAVMLKLNIDLTGKDITNKDNNGYTNNSSQNDTDNKYFHAKLAEGAKARVVASFNPKNTDETYDLEISYNNVSITKERNDFDFIINNFKEVTDDNGNITNNYSYVIVNASIKNISGTEFDTGVNNLWLCFDGLDQYFEMRSYSSGKDEPWAKDYYLVQFTKDFSQNYNLVYIVPDEIIENIDSNNILLITDFVNGMPNIDDIPLVKKDE